MEENFKMLNNWPTYDPAAKQMEEPNFEARAV